MVESDDTKKSTKRRPQRAPKVTIKVTQTEIDTSLPKHSGHCMIADAVKQAVPTAGRIAVDLQTIRWSDYAKGLRYTYLTPRVATVALVKFDQGVKPRPFGFRLRGAQVTSLRFKKTPGDKKTPALIHKFGKRQMVATWDEQHDGTVPDVIGGVPPPRFGTRREFGIRGLSLNEVYGKGKPNG